MRKALFLSVLCLGCLAACHAPQTSPFGSLMLSLSVSGMKSKTLVPPVDMNVAYYNVTGTGPSSASFSQTNVTATSFIKGSLVVGGWTIVVDGYNANNDLIGSGSTTVTINAGETTQGSVEVSPLTGLGGTLTIDISWPNGLITNASVVASLTDSSGTSQSLTFSTGPVTAHYSSATNSLDAGYHSLALKLFDDGTQTWGTLVAVRIIKNQTTAGSYELTAQDLNTGSVGLTITPVMQNPITITLSGQESQLPTGTGMTVTASTSSAVDTYQWYLNGSALSGQTNSAIVIGSGLIKGAYRLDLAVRKGSIISSEGISFSVIDAPAELVSTNLSETGTKLDIYFYRGPQFGYMAPPLYTVWVEDMNGAFMQDLFVSKSVGTNVYALHNNWAARPEASPYWAHKSCRENPYAGIPGRDFPGVYLALPTADGGPFPSDLDAVTSATRQVDFHLSTGRKDDGVSQFRVLLELQQSYDYNTSFPMSLYPIGGQPPLGLWRND